MLFRSPLPLLLLSSHPPLDADTVRAYKLRHQLGRFAPSPSVSSKSSEPAIPIPETFVPGARCEVALSEILSRRGTIRYVGTTEFGAKDESVWVGVEWDEPVGKGDGLCVFLRSLLERGADAIGAGSRRGGISRRHR